MLLGLDVPSFWVSCEHSKARGERSSICGVGTILHTFLVAACESLIVHILMRIIVSLRQSDTWVEVLAAPV